LLKSTLKKSQPGYRDSKVFDGAIILDCTNNSTMLGRTNTIKPLAPFWLHHQFNIRSIPSTVINYADFWDAEDLCKFMADWCSKNSIKRVMICASIMFNDSQLHNGRPVNTAIKLLKKNIDVTLIIGGAIPPADSTLIDLKPDGVFKARSLHLFLQYILDKAPVNNFFVKNKFDCSIYHNPTNVVVEDPIVPVLYDDFCLDHNDIIHFETRLGCKFNCTFCSHEFRNAKKVNDSEAEKIFTMMDSAYTRYGIKNFSCVDDTFNEDVAKLHNLLAATSELNYKPYIIGYQRFDLLMAKPEHLEILDEIGFHGHYYGIETLHREASKLIRKGIHKDQALNFMRTIRDKYPHWHTSSGYIVGVPLETKEHIIETISQLCDEKLLKAILPSPLGLYNIPGNEYNFSDFSKNPKKYGITVLGGNPVSLDWMHEHMHSKGAKVLSKRLAITIKNKGLSSLDPWEHKIRQLHENSNVTADMVISSYIQKKQNLV
jgi:hypothetical protein